MDPGFSAFNSSGALKVSNNVAVATTVAGLGAGQDGKIGLIRAGSTPFEFVQVMYDSTYGKWVSPQIFVGHSQYYNVTWDTHTTTSYTYPPASLGTDVQPIGWVPGWRDYDGAGLLPQGRVAGSIRTNTSSGQTGYVCPAFQAADLGDTSWTANGFVSAAEYSKASMDSNFGYAFATAWGQIAGGYTLKDSLIVCHGAKVSANSMYVVSRVFLRWVG